MIAVVDYGAANVLSITRALEAVGAEVVVSDRPEVLVAATGVVLPGVGAAGAAMRRMRETGTDAALREVVARGRPLLGICLGMQLFFEQTEEDDERGLGLLPGRVRLLPPGQKVPHIGWNALELAPDQPFFAGIAEGTHVYYVHSYVCEPADAALTVAWVEYGDRFCAAVARGSMYGIQFHPEKSSEAGLQMLRNWVTHPARLPAE